MDEIRKKKIEREMQRTIATLINSEQVKDPRVLMATIHRVELASDMSQATVFYTAYCTNNERKKLSAGLVSASGFFQSMIGKKMGLRYTPKLRFVWDSAYIKSLEVNRLIDESAPPIEVNSSDDSEFDEESPDHDDQIESDSKD
ncbi:MAG: 30S ribosome-binding factor RbfA [Leptospira sp.]|nr:30S ribosome-binding factor RbfA [Leptospira sp.]